MTQMLEERFIPRHATRAGQEHGLRAAQGARGLEAQGRKRGQAANDSDAAWRKGAGANPYGLWALATLTTSGLLGSLLWAFETVA